MKKIQYIEISKLKPYKDNPRMILPEDLEKLKSSIKKHKDFLQCRPLLVNKTKKGLIVYGGNQRLKALQELKYKKAPVIIDENLSETEMRYRAIADNTEFGQYNLEELENWEADIKSWDLPDHEFEWEVIKDTPGAQNEDQELNMDEMEDSLELECPKCHFKFLK